MKNVFFLSLLFFLGISCSKDEVKPTPTPAKALFTYIIKDKGLVQFENKSENSSVFEWNFGDQSTSKEQNPTHTYTSDGEYTITLTAKNSSRQDVYSQKILIKDLTLPIADFSVEIKEGKATFSNNSKHADAYFWSFGDDTTSTLVNPTHIYKENKSYTVKLTATNKAGEHSVEKQIVIADIAPSTQNKALFTHYFTNQLYVAKLDANNGEELWSKTGFSGKIHGTIVLHKDAIYFADESNIYALNAESGNVIWKKSIEKGSKSSPIITGENLIVGTENNKIIAYNLKTGAQIWETIVVSSISAVPTLEQNTLYIGTHATSERGGTFYAINATSGAIQWSRSSYFGSMNSKPIIVGDNVYFGGSGGFHNLNKNTGSLNAHSYIKIEYSTPIILENSIFAVVENKELNKLDLKTTSKLWSINLETDFSDSSPLLFENTLLIGTKKYLKALDKNSGEVLWKVDGDFNSKNLSVSKDILYISDNQQTLYAIDAKNRKILFTKKHQGHIGNITIQALDNTVIFPSNY